MKEDDYTNIANSLSRWIRRTDIIERLLVLCLVMLSVLVGFLWLELKQVSAEVKELRQHVELRPEFDSSNVWFEVHGLKYDLHKLQKSSTNYTHTLHANLTEDLNYEFNKLWEDSRETHGRLRALEHLTNHAQP
jgi:hypothetical protein